jgi:hypothetical protein
VRRIIRSTLLLSLGVVPLVVLWPHEAAAQQRARPRTAPPQVAVPRASYPARRPYYSRPYYYGGYYRPYYYAPYWGWGAGWGWGYGFYGAFGWGWPHYRYPYPYYPYYFDDRSEIRFQVTPREAQVYVDGYFVGLVDDFDGWAQRLHLEPGEHDVEIYLEGYRTRRERMLVRPRQGYTVRFALEPLGAGEAQDPRPSAPPPAPQGTRPPDRYAPPRRVEVERGAMGSLRLRVQPADAVVLVDGERWEWPAGEDRLTIDLPEGTHRVEVQREGHQPYGTTITIRRGETTPLNVSLRRD